jgi:uncharacterized protein YkwD
MFSRRHAATFLVAAVAALAAPAGAQAHAQDAACPGADVVPAAGNLTQVASATLCLLNDERDAAGLHPLTVAQGLTQPSASYSARMVSENFFAHVAPDGATLTDRLEAGGYIEPDGDWTVGENIAWGQGDISTARSIMIAWMNSPGHRENILTPEFSEVGIGIVPGTPGDTSWGATYTTDFGDVIDDSGDTVATTASAGTKTRKAARKAKAKVKSCKVKAASARAANVKRTHGKHAVKSAKAKRGATCSAPAKTTSRKAR